MAEGLNRVMLLGNLGADPELRDTGSGSVLKLRLATSERYKRGDGSWAERTEWHSVSMWGPRGEALARILHQGDRVFIEGALRTRSWEQDGSKRYATEVNATNVLLCGGQGGQGERGERPAARRDPPRNPPPSGRRSLGTPVDDIDDDDIPF
uniref:Putative single-stranded DNA-binding protein n=1 Tax=viral metagenome TaxID=1070528 RepID=A0A6M3ILZ9_9ZZZZ